MKTRPEICATIEDGKPCEEATVYLGEVVSCDLIHGCDGKPCASAYAAAISNPASACEHASGNRWKDAQVVKLNIGVPVIAGVNWLDQRAAGCMNCEDHLGAYHCRSNGGQPVNDLVLDPSADCPRTPNPVWRAVKMAG